MSAAIRASLRPAVRLVEQLDDVAHLRGCGLAAGAAQASAELKHAAGVGGRINVSAGGQRIVQPPLK